MAEEAMERDPKGALVLAQEACKLAPTLVPAAAISGRLTAQTGDYRRASRMLVDGAHPNRWVDPSATMQLADIGNFDIALGDIPKSLELIEKQAESISHLAALGGRTHDHIGAAARSCQ